ncbi:conserved hypothetical protein [Altererythrobacter sp. B11]|nr:conserved hypothetical protein [Altererythrobacter sp. B11]
MWGLGGGLALALAAVAVPAQLHAQEQAPVSSASTTREDPAVPAPPADANLPEVEPIISEQEFEEEVPDLESVGDDALEAPLESIEEFERRVSSEQADAAPAEGQEAPLGDPALADGDASEAIGDAPVRDAELAAPLPPLDQFDVQPVEFAEAEQDRKDVEIAYSMQVNGLEKADEESDADLRDMFDDLSALRDGDGEAANVAQISARLTEDSALIQRILASEGWYGAAATTRIDRPQTDDGKLAAVIDVVPGQRYVFSEITIKAPPTEPPGLIQDALALEVGEPIIAERVQAAEAKVAVTLPQSGYPFADLGQRDILLDQDTGEGVYTLPVDTGPRSVFGGIRTTGDLAFDAEHVAVLARFKRGELYDSRKVDDLRKALVATGLFNTVSVEPEKTGEPATDGTEYATLLVEQEAGPPRTLAGGAGYGTGQGLRVEGSWSHRNLFPPEGALIVNAVAGTQEQGAGVTFRRSNAGRRDRTFQLSADALHSNYDAYEAFTGRIAGLVSYSSTPIWQKRLTYAYGAQAIITNEQDFDPAIGERRRRTFYIAGLTGQVGLDTTDDLLNPTEGFRLTALVEPEGSLEDGFTPYVRGRLDGSAYVGVGSSLVLAGRVRLGTIQGIDRYDLAPSRRFYAGGGGSVRGFGYQELGPKSREPNPDYDPTDPEEEDDPFIYRPIGGRSVVEGAAEVRYRFGNFGAVAFVDAGQVYEASMPQFDDIRYGVGIGGRYYTNFGPLRVDVAMPIDRRVGESKFTVYVSIGQAF